MGKKKRKRIATTEKQKTEQLRRRWKRPASKTLLEELATVDWRLNFYETHELVGITSPRGVPLPEKLQKLLKQAVDEIGGNYFSPQFTLKPSDPEEDEITKKRIREGFTIYGRKEFIEIVADYPVIEELVNAHGLKIRCNYWLEPVEDMITMMKQRRNAVVRISDGRWNNRRDID